MAPLTHTARIAAVALLATLLLGPGRAADSAPPARTVQVSVRDGTTLATDIYLPSGYGPFPTILARTPYNKSAGAGLGVDGARRGYAVVLQDVRGRFASGGDNLPFNQDGPDGYDTLRWVRAQSWCNGRVGTWGGSAGAITQFQLAASGVDGLTCQHLVVGAPNLYEVVYDGGVFRKALVEDWLRTSRFGPEALPRWVSHPRYDDYWRARDASRHYRNIHAPAVHIGGYWDIFAQGTIDAFRGYQERGGSGARGRQKLILGPWTHGVLQDKAGELTFPDAKRPPGNVHDAWTWFDHWLKGLPNGIDQSPAVTYYVIGDVTDPKAPGNQWRTASAWPPVPTRATRYYFHGDGRLGVNRPGQAPPRTYAYSPTNPAPTLGGVQLTLPAGPMDQRTLEARDDVLVFTSDALSEPVEITGRVWARLWIASDAKDTDFMVRLCDVYPDGRSFNLCEGRLRTRFREGLDRERWLTPGRVQAVDIDLWSTSVIFNRGHRIRVQVTSSSAPGYDPNPNTGEGFRASARSQTAHNAVHVDRRRPSHVRLPVAVSPGGP